MSKTRKCNWCKKRFNIEHGYILDKEFFICDKCNLIYDCV